MLRSPTDFVSALRTRLETVIQRLQQSCLQKALTVAALAQNFMPEQTWVRLGPTHVEIWRIKPGQRMQIKERRSLTCSPVPGEPEWQAAVTALKEELAAPEWHKAGVRVVLSNHFSRYVVVPWISGLTSDEEDRSYVRHCFSNMYGKQCEAWAVRTGETQFGAPRVASAVDEGLVQALREAVKDNGLRLCSVQTYLASAFNASRHRLSGDRFWFVVAEPGRLCMAWLCGGQWRSIHNRRIGKDWLRELPLALARERLLVDEPDRLPKVFVYAAELGESNLLVGEWTEYGLKLPLQVGNASMTGRPVLVEEVS